MQIEKKVIKRLTQCDFCELDSDDHIIEECSKCEKDICYAHMGQAEEDGVLCIDCSKLYEIYYPYEEDQENGEWGSVGLRDKKTGKDVKW